MYEDAACAYPCGEEPMGCPGCPELHRTSPPKTREDFYKKVTYEQMEVCDKCGGKLHLHITSDAFHTTEAWQCEDCGNEGYDSWDKEF